MDLLVAGQAIGYGLRLLRNAKEAKASKQSVAGSGTTATFIPASSKKALIQPPSCFSPRSSRRSVFVPTGTVPSRACSIQVSFGDWTSPVESIAIFPPDSLRKYRDNSA